MGTHYKYQITVVTANGPVGIDSEQITKIEKAPDLGALITITHPEKDETVEVLTVESFLRVLTYFKD
ncbi:hypothetical protein DIU31_023345 [Mucilaginibacter rubeus]|uniref:Uncharacterized protein n=1 Tax=Mucilaginibacter rubeus TaxID=2027860 RepID=A0AAE6JIK2_9SPHI|nr:MULTISPECIES: hypothetical protein [Mucilaginibacter]QEM06311.1 hypothetical protein DIU31_023345 [Mucilaginibacter rubeus]QEM18893.1 hypothetical protein DIU38_023580 [Mucilaginibacter gossypii]QTE44563.1 hypothetical protein J3L19_04135 [Mucilaginibacter rubeus]QTE51161.1 hypothetical protein J3L21_04110 [Mucilaginibacter rubeus]QTE56249.1 hypothetical protein J3L23_29360 [Mucilaginibacter rubeus]